MNKTIETFIFVHDQNIIVDYEQNNKFKDFDDYKYVFLGFGDTTKLVDLTNIIYAKDLKYNLEKYNKMCAYSGWYVLFMNELVTADYVNLFEYDVTICDNFINKLSDEISDYIDIYSYVPMDIRIEFITNPLWISDLAKFYSFKKKTNLIKEVSDKIIENNIGIWASTSNVTLNSDFFYDYMNDVCEIFEWMKQWNSVGHGLERLLAIYLILNNKTNIKYFNHLIKHYQLDSHKTQHHSVNFENSLKKLSNNE